MEIKRSAISLAMTLASYWIYATIIAPILEPPLVHRQSTAQTPRSSGPRAVERFHDELAALFPAGAWETQSPKVLRNRNTLLLFQDYQPQEDGTIRIFPCTVVMREAPSDTASVLIMQAPEGAVLQLDRPVDLKGAQLGQPVAGRLLGRIEIQRPGLPDGRGRLRMVTANVQINPEGLWTPHEVELEYEQSRARGQDLMIKLMPTQVSVDPEKPTGWAGLRSIELVHLEYLHLEVIADERPDDAVTAPATPIDVACRGPLRVDFIENLMTFEDAVELRRTNPDGKIDTLTCDRLAFHLQPIQTPSPTVDNPTPAPADRKRPPKLTVQRVVAEGNPVILDAESRNAQIRSRKLLYDLPLGRFRLWSAANDPQDQVLFRYQARQILARELDCSLDGQGGIERAIAEGPGTFRGELTGANPQEVAAAWDKVLIFEREEALYHLTVAKRASVYVGTTDGIEADMIHLWLEPTPQVIAAHPPTDVNTDKGLAFRPQRAVAMANPDQPLAEPVRLRSAGMLGTTQRLDAVFLHILPAQTDAAATTLPVRATRVSTASPTPRPSPLARQRSTAAAPTRETQVTGDALHVTLRMQGKQISLQDLLLQDNVRVEQIDLADPGNPLFALRGNAVRIRGQGDQQNHVLSAIGSPVTILSDRMQLQTTELRVDQQRNVVWAEQPGRMTLLIDRDAQGRPLATPQQATVDWQRRMDFDGLTATFDGRVEVLSPDQRMRAEKMSVQLNQRINLTRPNGGTPLDIEQVRGEGNVMLESQQREVGRLLSVSYLQAPYANVDRTSGDLQAGGPGRVITLRDGFRGNLSFGAVTPNTGPVAAPSEDNNKTFLQIDYQRQIKGNLHRRIIEFENRVQVVYGPVGSWNESLRADAPLRQHDVLLSCDRLTVAEGALSGNAKPTIDLLAQGNAYVEGQTFTAHGERLSYEQGKDLLVLEGTGQTDAVLSHQARVGSTPSATAARKIRYWPGPQRVEVEDVRYLDLSELGR